MNEVMIALITPFTQNDTIDYRAMDRLLRRLLKEGCEGFVVCGTTAETPTLTHSERITILRHVIKRVKHRVPIWYGCGTNNTAATIQACKEAEKEDIDGVLLVTPYYNKPTAAGLFAHYDAVASAIHANIMLYNVPSRTGVELDFETIDTLIEKHSNICALKQACTNLDVVHALKKKHPQFLIYSGEDGYFDEGIEAGMDGLISVMGHVCLPQLIQFLDGGRKDKLLRNKLYELADLTFCEASPAPIKYMLYERGECESFVRLPLVRISESAKQNIDAYLARF